MTNCIQLTSYLLKNIFKLIQIVIIGTIQFIEENFHNLTSIFSQFILQ